MFKSFLYEAKIFLVLVLAAFLPTSYLNKLDTWLGHDDESDDTNPVITARRPVRTSSIPREIVRVSKAQPHPHLHINNRDGFSLVELMIVIAILGILCAISLPALSFLGPSPDEKMASATRNAQAWASSMQINATGITCSGADKESDGYITCSVGISGEPPFAIECGYDLAWAPQGQNTGCKPALPKFNYNQVQ